MKSSGRIPYWGALNSDSSVLTGAEVDGNEHPQVYSIVNRNNGVSRGSGVLLSPTVMLTAGHLLDPVPGVTQAVTCDPVVDNTNGHFVSFTGVQHPDWDRSLSVARYQAGEDNFDIGLVFLNEPIEVKRYGTIPREGHVGDIYAGCPSESEDCPDLTLVRAAR